MPLSWAPCYEEHFQRYFGKPYDVHVYGAGREALRIATYDRAYPDFRVHASLGIADLLPEGEDAGEVITVADDLGPDVPFLFANALLFVLQNKIALGTRFTVGGVEALRPHFADLYDKSALYFMLAEGFREGFDMVECGADTGTVYQAIFVSDEEAEYIQEKGGAAFEARVKAQDADLCRLRRLSCV
jgi:hypothetical protein